MAEEGRRPRPRDRRRIRSPACRTTASRTDAAGPRALRPRRPRTSRSRRASRTRNGPRPPRATSTRASTNSEGSQASSGPRPGRVRQQPGLPRRLRVCERTASSPNRSRSEGDSMQRDYWMTVRAPPRGSRGRRRASVARPQSAPSDGSGGKRVETCEVPVIFDGMTAPSLIGQVASCGQRLLDLSRVELPRRDKLGESIAASAVTIIDDGRLPGGLGSKPFDGEGRATRRNVIVDERPAEDVAPGRPTRAGSSACPRPAARRAAPAPPRVSGTTNLWLEPGDKTLEEFIAELDRGLVVTELIGMGFNPTTGDYSRGAAGLWVETRRGRASRSRRSRSPATSATC